MPTSSSDIGKKPVAGQGHIQIYPDKILSGAYSKGNSQNLVVVVGSKSFSFQVSKKWTQLHKGKHHFILALAENNILYHAPTASIAVTVKRSFRHTPSSVQGGSVPAEPPCCYVWHQRRSGLSGPSHRCLLPPDPKGYRLRVGSRSLPVLSPLHLLLRRGQGIPVSARVTASHGGDPSQAGYRFSRVRFVLDVLGTD